ncbi:MAG: NAD-dependent epimerase/dehydratase family protein [Alphaproteobacteria bacterium]|nr:NAD-dependent epimerase/dehydratase family protein [Alphaproteobacteria bacterium]
MSDTVLITGITGFIAKWVARDLLKAGFSVRGTLRTAAREKEVRDTLTAEGADTSGLAFAVADLTSDKGWAEAAAGCRYVQHIASPFPLNQPRGREDLVPGARDGALRVLKAACDAGVERIVMTSSMVAMTYRANRPRHLVVRETDWTDPDWPPCTPYIISKTRAERAAWDFMTDRGLAGKFTVVNPAFVLGPAMDKDSGTSLDAIALIMRGTYPALPPVHFPIVDVRDLSRLHVATMTADVAGRRLIGAGETWSLKRMAGELRAAFPAYAAKIPTREMPAFFVHLLGLFDRPVRALRADMGVVPVADSQETTALTGVTFRPAAEAVRAAGETLIRFGLV